MNLKDAQEQIECQHPELTGAEKTKAIKRLRSQSEAAKKTQTGETGRWPSVAESWGSAAAVIFGIRALAWAVWSVPFDAPGWYDALFGVQLILGVALVTCAHRRRQGTS
ncbi:hypothetical protein [Streptomyces aureus]|uniref:hypothetical protein n=1 Tax=Streptomyces aureus TaxID=193461 RepID=UPI000561F238|nr:hypothetical protein [Streptomyces aureus]